MLDKLKYNIAVSTLMHYIRLIVSKINSKSVYNDQNFVALLDTSIGTENLGDYIIMDYCKKNIAEIFHDKKLNFVPTHIEPTQRQIRELGRARYKLLCGTNILQGDMNKPRLFRLPKFYPEYKGIILMGTGWNSYSKKRTIFTGLFYKFLLDRNKLHAVRDEYTKRQLESFGINNVICTACPTMWRLTKEFCSQIKCKKSREVVTTLTDYDQDVELDSKMITILCDSYDHVYLWLQGSKDRKYYEELSGFDRRKITLIGESLEIYDQFLCEHCEEIDYVGTRLHGGIRALNHKIRTIIVAVDNRAIEIGKTTNLLVVSRADIEERLKKMIFDDQKMDICIPEENIRIWKGQFQNE